MGFLSDLFRGKERPPSPLHQWGVHGPRVTKDFIRGQKMYDQRQRARQKRALTTGFNRQIKMTQRDAQRGAAARGLGKSTVGMAIAPTMQLKMQRSQALSQLPEVPSHFYRYMGKKAQYGALEPWQSYLSQGGRAGGLLGTLGTAVGSYFGGPICGQIGGQIGNAI